MKSAIKARILEAGFDLVGVAACAPLHDDATRFENWLQSGRAGAMTYLARGAGARREPAALLPGARSAIVAACAYAPIIPPAPLASYAARTDYHIELRRALEGAVETFAALAPGAHWRIAVDAAPILERALAARAGLGWVGRSTNLITERFGPYVLLAEILTDLEIEPDAPRPELCGECGRCLEACPTRAFAAPYVLDARRCISYLTIEKRGRFDANEALWAAGRTTAGQPARTFAFGCDLCIAACPHAERLITGAVRPAGKLIPAHPHLSAAGAEAVERLCVESFRRNFGETPVARAGKAGLLRNLHAADLPNRPA